MSDLNSGGATFTTRTEVFSCGGDANMASTRSFGIFAVIFLAACGASVPHAEVADARAAISAAEASGAEQVPRAALHVKIAKDNVARAEQLIGDDENDEAREALERASADAKLASSLTREDQVRSETNAAIRRTEQLRSRTTF
jgi:hypothetical protein